MTTSRDTDWMNHPVLRRLVGEANALELEERLTLLKGIIPGIAAQMTPKDFASFALELRYRVIVAPRGDKQPIRAEVYRLDAIRMANQRAVRSSRRQRPYTA